MKSKVLGDHLRLAHLSGAERAAVDLHQADDVGLDGMDKVQDLLQGRMGWTQIARIGKGKMKPMPVPCCIANVVE